MAENQYFTCVGASHGALATPADKAAWINSRNASWLPGLCRRIQTATDDEQVKKLKSKLPIWTPRCAEFRAHHRKESEVLKPLNRLMLDIDEKGHTDEIMARCRRFGEQLYLDCDYYTTLRVLLIEDSVRLGTHILVELPDGLTPEEVQQLVSDKIGFKCDPAVKNVAGCIYMVPMSYTKFVDEALFTVDCHSEPTAKNLTEPDGQQPKDPPSVDCCPLSVVNRDDNLDYQGIPYSSIISKYWDLYNNGKTPCAGNRNVLTYELAMTLRSICDYDQAFLERVIPRYDGFAEDEWRKTIANALKEPRKSMPYRLREVLKEIRRENSSIILGGTADTPPPMPKNLPSSLALLCSKVPEYYKPAVCDGVFPALGTHLHGVRFIYTDNVMHEATFMNVLMAPMSSGKSCIKKPIDYIMADIKENDAHNREREAEYKRKNPNGKAKKDPRPQDICIQILIDNLTDAVFNQRVADADYNGHRFIYMRVDEIEQLKKVTSKGTIDEVGIIMRKAWDNADHGQERVGSESVTGIAPLRWNFNASSTIQNGCKFLNKACNDGTLSRLNITTIIKPDTTELPVYGLYDGLFAEQLKPYIDRLNAANGLIECPEALELARAITQENSIRAAEMDSEAFQELSYRANVIAYLKGMVLYIMNNYEWTQEIADYVRWSEQMDLWCKMRFFGKQLEEQMNEEKYRINNQPENLFALMPNEFSYEEYLKIRRKTGHQGDGKNTLRQWKKRQMVYKDEVSDVWVKLKK